MTARVSFRLTLVLQFLLLATAPLLSQTRLIPDGDPPIVINTTGEWGPVFQWPVVAIHMSVLPNGRVATWERKDTVLTTETWIWNPKATTNPFTKVMNPYASVFCSGHTYLANGKLLVAGGHHFKDGFGEKTLTFFDGTAWTKGPDMNAGRWYPTTLMLRNGDVVVVGGSQQGAQEAMPNPLPQVWQAATSTWRNLSGAIRSVPLYPMLLLAPDGRVFMPGPNPGSAFLNTTGAGSWTSGPQSTGGFRDYGSAVEYEPGKILLVGGGAPTATAEIINLNVANPQWVRTGSMKFARRQLNATILPDGKVLVTGGTSAAGFNNANGSVLPAEMWDPATGAWTTMASQQQRRLYHSTAVLLPDGRVLSAGGGLPPSPQGGDTDHRNAQLFSPPYLLRRGIRPVITSAPASVTYGQTFTIQTPTASSVKWVTLVRLSSTTHAFNQSQRFNRLTPTLGSGQVTVKAPLNAACPPGPYLLFLLSNAGIPSEGKVIFIR